MTTMRHPDAFVPAQDALRRSVLALPGITSAHARILEAITTGRQVRVEASTSVSSHREQLEILTAIARLCWHNAAFVPVDTRVYLDTGSAQAMDLTAIGTRWSGARPGELYERFGPPASAPDWHP